MALVVKLRITKIYLYVAEFPPEIDKFALLLFPTFPNLPDFKIEIWRWRLKRRDSNFAPFPFSNWDKFHITFWETGDISFANTANCSNSNILLSNFFLPDESLPFGKVTSSSPPPSPPFPSPSRHHLQPLLSLLLLLLLLLPALLLHSAAKEVVRKFTK